MNVLLANPTWPVKDSTGNYFQVNQENKRNPLAMIEYTDFKVMTDRLLSGVSANLEIIKGLNYKINFGVDHSIAVARINQSSELNYMKTTNGQANINNKELNRYLIEHTLSYSKVLGVHNFTALGGFSYQHQLVQGYNIGTQNYPSNDVLYTYNLQASQTTLSTPSSYGNIDEMQSVFGRLNYNLMEKYLFTINFRRDGSSKFGANKKYGNFPSGAFAWRLSEEPFIKNLNIFDNLKLRLGWGKTGNQEIGSKYSIFSLRSQNDAKAILDGSTITQGYVLSRTPNPDVTWETTTSTDVGIDYGFFKGKLSGTIDYFNRKTTGMLMEVPSKQPAPTGSQMVNVDGFVINDGLELGINGNIFTRVIFHGK